MAPSTVGPVVVGTTTAEELRMAGRTWDNTGVVTSVDAGRRFTWRTTSGVPASGSRTVTPLPGDRCRVDLTLAVTPPGVQRLLRPVLARLLARGLAADAERLRVLVGAAALRG
ncbi:SRPBCC family protein [Blastococcus sp. SYSU D00813]